MKQKKKTRPETAKKEKLALLRKADLFSKLNGTELAVIARYSGYSSFEPDQIIFTEGSHSEELYLIKEGAVLIRKKMETGGELDIARFLKGEVFAEMDLLDSTPRTASAVAQGATTLLVFPREGTRFTEILEKHPDLFARILQKLLGVIAGRIRATDKLISEKTPWIQELKKQIQRDKLTSLHNRAYLDEELGGILERLPLTSFLVVKPDNFKSINDTYGHDAGDAALILIAETLKSCLKEGDIGVRYRGDEFCIVMPGRQTEEAIEKARGLLSAFKGMNVSRITAGETFTLTASIGISMYPHNAKDGHTLVARSFEKMLDARSEGGDRIHGQEEE